MSSYWVCFELSGFCSVLTAGFCSCRRALHRQCLLPATDHSHAHHHPPGPSGSFLTLAFIKLRRRRLPRVPPSAQDTGAILKAIWRTKHLERRRAKSGFPRAARTENVNKRKAILLLPWGIWTHVAELKQTISNGTSPCKYYIYSVYILDGCV